MPDPAADEGEVERLHAPGFEERQPDIHDRGGADADSGGQDDVVQQVAHDDLAQIDR
ncbi:hypothetical protein D3C81_2230630 [compost metagenome]